MGTGRDIQLLLVETIAAAHALAALLEAAYTYDTINEKRFVLGDGGQSGNCEWCVDAADMGWIPDDDLYEGPMGDEDGPPLHPNDTCSLEYRERRYRVYGG